MLSARLLKMQRYPLGVAVTVQHPVQVLAAPESRDGGENRDKAMKLKSGGSKPRKSTRRQDQTLRLVTSCPMV